jgi:hypothetical protein
MAGDFSQDIDGATLTTPATPSASATSENQTPFIVFLRISQTNKPPDTLIRTAGASLTTRAPWRIPLRRKTLFAPAQQSAGDTPARGKRAAHPPLTLDCQPLVL